MINAVLASSWPVGRGCYLAIPNFAFVISPLGSPPQVLSQICPSNLAPLICPFRPFRPTPAFMSPLSASFSIVSATWIRASKPRAAISVATKHVSLPFPGLGVSPLFPLFIMAVSFGDLHEVYPIRLVFRGRMRRLSVFPISRRISSCRAGRTGQCTLCSFPPPRRTPFFVDSHTAPPTVNAYSCPVCPSPLVVCCFPQFA